MYHYIDLYDSGEGAIFHRRVQRTDSEPRHRGFVLACGGHLLCQFIERNKKTFKFHCVCSHVGPIKLLLIQHTAVAVTADSASYIDVAAKMLQSVQRGFFTHPIFNFNLKEDIQD